MRLSGGTDKGKYLDFVEKNYPLLIPLADAWGEYLGAGKTASTVLIKGEDDEEEKEEESCTDQSNPS